MLTSSSPVMQMTGAITVSSSGTSATTVTVWVRKALWLAFPKNQKQQPAELNVALRVLCNWRWFHCWIIYKNSEELSHQRFWHPQLYPPLHQLTMAPGWIHPVAPSQRQIWIRFAHSFHQWKVMAQMVQDRMSWSENVATHVCCVFITNVLDCHLRVVV